MGAGPVTTHLGLLCVFMVLSMSSDNAEDDGVGLLYGVWMGHVQSLVWNQLRLEASVLALRVGPAVLGPTHSGAWGTGGTADTITTHG